MRTPHDGSVFIFVQRNSQGETCVLFLLYLKIPSGPNGLASLQVVADVHLIDLVRHIIVFTVKTTVQVDKMTLLCT